MKKIRIADRTFNLLLDNRDDITESVDDIICRLLYEADSDAIKRYDDANPDHIIDVDLQLGID